MAFKMQSHIYTADKFYDLFVNFQEKKDILTFTSLSCWPKFKISSNSIFHNLLVLENHRRIFLELQVLENSLKLRQVGKI